MKSVVRKICPRLFEHVVLKQGGMLHRLRGMDAPAYINHMPIFRHMLQYCMSNVPLLPHQVSFQAIGTGSGILGYRPCLRPSPFPIRIPHLGVFSIHSTLSAIGFHSCFFFTTDVSVLIGPSLTYSLLCEFPGFGPPPVPDVLVPEAEQGCAWRKISFQILV